MKRLYLTTDPFTLTDINELETTTYANLEELLKAALKVSCEVYVYDLDKLSKAFVGKFFKMGFEEVLTANMDSFTSEIEPKQFVSVGSAKEGMTVMLRVRRHLSAQIRFFNLKRLYGNLTKEQIAYSFGIDNEIEAMSYAIDSLISEGHKAWTLSGNALNDLKKECFGKLVKGKIVCAAKNFEEAENFPKLDDKIHNLVMESFQGGICYFNEEYKGKEINFEGIEYDVNSMYPSIMMHEYLPCGLAYKFEGQYEFDRRKPFYFQKLKISKIKLKDRGIPTIRDRINESYYREAEDIEVVLNHIDMQLMYENYDVEGIEYDGGYKFQGRKKMFDKFLYKWAYRKLNAKDPYERTYAKLMLNSSFGKFASKIDKVPSKYVILPGGKVSHQPYGRAKKKKEGTSVYAPVGAYITSYGRRRLLNAIKANRDNFIYSDTDSIYIKGCKAYGLDIDDKRFGAWKKEFEFNKMYIVGKKQYIVRKKDGTYKVACSGMPSYVIDSIKDFEDFQIGKKFEYNIYGYDFEGMHTVEKDVYELKDIEIK